MSDPVNLDERRWAKEGDPRAHAVVTMLRVAIGQIERGEIIADHGILCVGGADGEAGTITTDWLQAGKFLGFAQLGLLERVKYAIIDTAERA